jgi:phosphate transport system protein
MPRERFEHELERLQRDVLTLGTAAEKALVDSVETLRTQDLVSARALIENDRVINERRFALENEVITLIATQQPMAGDLRILAEVLELVGEFERIADYAKGIANITLMIGTEPLMKPLVEIPAMAAKAADMLHRALDAFIRRDVELARAIPKEDVEVDALYEHIYRVLLTYIMQNPKNIDQATRLTWVAHNLERVADRVSNICERVVYSVTGKIEELAGPPETQG